MGLAFLVFHLQPPLTVLRAAEIDCIWLGYPGGESDRLVVSWWSDEPGDSVVRFGLTPESLETVRQHDLTRLHHVEIPVPAHGAIYYYCVQTGSETSSLASFKAIPTETLRIAVAADWQSQPDLTAIRRDDVHLLLTAGDTICNLWEACGPGRLDCFEPYRQLIRRYPDLFRRVPFMPVLGNHDREIHPRGQKPPVHPVYDVEATAFRQFFVLPDDEWKWSFNIPEFNLRLIALDLSHTSDVDSTWQTCHSFDPGAVQYRWYDRLTTTNPTFTVTLYNERNATMRNTHQGAWEDLFRRGTICVTGFGYFAERAEVNDLTYYNTALSGAGTVYPDPHSVFLAREDSYMLLTCEQAAETMTAELKNLSGHVLDRRQFSAKTNRSSGMNTSFPSDTGRRER